ncbi:uncharacterized protein LOC135499778 [Lineus longissimus]|uniref:uncharacterized protein LOC135499778 n=1 Tax=Lineus longissimus TaxID=88925 RepID=UPI00315CD275
MAPILVRLLFGAAVITLTVSHKDENGVTLDCKCDGDKVSPNDPPMAMRPVLRCCTSRSGARSCCNADETACFLASFCCSACIARISAWTVVGLLNVYFWVTRMLVLDKQD